MPLPQSCHISRAVAARLGVFGLMVCIPALVGTLTIAPSAQAAEELAQAEAGTAVLPLEDMSGGENGARDALPSVLSSQDISTYREIFRIQSDGHWKRADALMKRLDDDLLMGHVLAQRYLHPTKYRSSWPELRDWLGRYADHPDVNRLHRLAMKRKPGSAAAPKAPVKGYLGGSGADAVAEVSFYVSPRERTAAEQRAVRDAKRSIRRAIRKGRLSAAMKTLSAAINANTFDTVEIAQARASIAKGYFVFGKDTTAHRLARLAADAAGDRVPEAHWTAGMAAWRLGKLEEATGHFEQVSLSERATRAERAAGAYWASRGHLQTRKPADATRWLARAAQYPLTFYGLLGRRALGVEIPFDWSLPRLTDARMERLMAYDGARRAVALKQVDESFRAEREWRKLFPRLDADLREPLLTLATRYNMPGLAIRMAGILRVTTGRIYHAALYPVPEWSPQDGFEVDRAIVYGLIRQESGFDPRARSGRGARGLMQLMPRTANSVDHDDDIDGRHELYDPELNMALGQRYVMELLEMERVQGDLFRLLTAYNAGPGNLNKWNKRVDFKDDPLLFIESIPSWETREFIEKVLANIWIYRYRLNQPAPSLDRAAAGDWPTYSGIDGTVGYTLRQARY